MLKRLKVFIIIIMFSFFGTENKVNAKYEILAYDFAFKDLDGSTLNLSDFKNKVIIVVNVASQCGFTNQYEDMQKVWEKYQKKGLIMIGIPSNDFGNQEPGKEAEIKQFCEVNFDVDFPLTNKVHVSGSKAHPFYQWAAGELGMLAKPRWNFHKYLIGPDGQLADWLSTPTFPTSGKVIKANEAQLALSKSSRQ